MAGATLCATKFNGKLKGAIARTGPTPKALHQPPAALVALGQVEGNALAAQTRGLFRGGLEGEHRTIHLRSRQSYGLACLSHNQLRKALLLLDQRGSHVFKNLAAFPARQRAGSPKAGHRMIHGLARVGPRGHSDAADQALVPRRPHFQRIPVIPFLAAQQKSRLRSRPHLHRELLTKNLRS